MFCVQCGGDVPAGSRFCPRCGRAAAPEGNDGPASASPFGAPSASPSGPPTMPPPTPPPPPPPPPPAYGSAPPPPGAYGAAPGGYPGAYPPPPYGAGSGPVAYGLASLGQRFGGFLIDWVIMAALWFGGVIIAVITAPSATYDSYGNSTSSPSGIGVLIMLLFFLAAFAYPAFFEGRPDGQTLGKKAVGSRVVRQSNGAPLGYGLAIGRLFARFVDSITFGLGLLWCLWDPQRQTFHDKIAGTLVVRTDVYPPPGKTPAGSQQPAPPPNPYHTG